MRDPSANIFDSMSADDAKFVRETMIDAIIATDLAYHEDHNRVVFQSKLDSASFSKESDADQRMLVLMSLKLADLANPSKGWEVYSRWIACLFTEFYQQGDLELSVGKQPAPHMDRNGPTCPAKAQQGFITHLMRPLLEEWAKVRVIWNQSLVMWSGIVASLGQRFLLRVKRSELTCVCVIAQVLPRLASLLPVLDENVAHLQHWCVHASPACSHSSRVRPAAIVSIRHTRSKTMRPSRLPLSLST